MSDFMEAMNVLDRAEGIVHRLDPEHPALAHLDAARDAIVREQFDTALSGRVAASSDRSIVVDTSPAGEGAAPHTAQVVGRSPRRDALRPRKTL